MANVGWDMLHIPTIQQQIYGVDMQGSNQT